MAQMPILVVLAGGASSRMWPLREKLLMRFGTEPLLISQLRRFQALGLQGQFIYVDPESRTVIVKLSYFPPEDQTTRDEVAAFFAAASAWKPR